ncbi:MAG TPA: transcriptional regulator [Porticoccaceae bacterium]|nr:transcriptional regulator [Porticoccaceae bacterium]
MKPAELTETICAELPSLRRSERKVAEYVLSRPEEIIRLRIVDLAEQAQVSEPTVIRFCRAIGCNGFLDFKLALAQQLAASPSFGQIAITDTDSLAEYTFKTFDSTIDSLLQVRDRLDLDMLDKAVQALCAASRVEFYGFGASAAVARDAQHRFFRLRLATAAYSDPHLQNMSATSLTPGDVVVAFSQSGRTEALLESIDLVKKNGAIVIALAPTGSPVAQAATIPLTIDVEEDIQIYTPLSSRIAHLIVIDVLAIGVAQQKGPELQEHLQQMQENLNSLRVAQPD